MDFIKGRVQISRNSEWDTLTDNTYYNFTLVKISIIMTKDYLGRYSKTSIEKIYETIQYEISNISQNFGGKIWFWQNNTGMLVFHFGDYTNSAVLAGIYFLHNFFIMCFETLKLDEMLNFKISIHNGDSGYKKTDTDHISSDIINSIVHLDNYFTKEDNLVITEDVYKKLSVRLIPYFEPLDIYEEKQIYYYTP